MANQRNRSSHLVRRRLFGAILVALPLLAPATGQAAVSTFGSPLAVAATKDTANDLGYTGSNVALPGSVFHIPHDGADTALWNTGPGGAQAAPASGQITSVRLEGCAQQPSGAPSPLTQIHFQDLVPQLGGGARINVTTQPFDIPVCGQNGASGSTVTTFAPTNFCVSQGDYVDFNDEGGFVPRSSGSPPYPAGVPYLVIGAVQGSTMNSFIRNNGVGNGAMMSPRDTTYHDGFVANPDVEVMLQATLGTGPDATPLCSGGTRGVHASGPHPALAAMRVSPQTDGVNHSRVVSVAIYCRPSVGCQGMATLTVIGRGASNGRLGVLGSARFNLQGNKTSHLPICLGSRVIGMLRKRRGGLPATLSVAAGGATVTQTIVLRIF